MCDNPAFGSILSDLGNPRNSLEYYGWFFVLHLYFLCLIHHDNCSVLNISKKGTLSPNF